MVVWIAWYSIVVVLCVGVGLRYFRGEVPTLLICLVAAALGVAGMGVVDIVIHGRYLLANRAEAKRRRTRSSRAIDSDLECFADGARLSVCEPAKPTDQHCD